MYHLKDNISGPDLVYVSAGLRVVEGGFSASLHPSRSAYSSEFGGKFLAKK